MDSRQKEADTGKRVLAIIPKDFFESIVETLEILGDEELMGAFEKGVKEMEEGKGVEWEKVKRELNL